MAETSPPVVFPSQLPVLPLRRTVVFPLTLQPLAVNRPMSVEAVNTRARRRSAVLLLLQKGDDDEPAVDEMHDIGTIGIIRQMARGPQGLNIIVEGMARARVDDVDASKTACCARTLALAPEQVAERRRSRRLRSAHSGAGRSRAVADVRSGARSPSAGRRHRRPDAAGVSARRRCSISRPRRSSSCSKPIRC